MVYAYFICLQKKPLNTHKQSILKSAESQILEWVSINRGYIR